jgi:hypothetical protein
MKIKEMILGEKIPDCLTLEGWNDWDVKMKKDRPIRFWLSDVGFEYIMDMVDFFKDIKHYFLNRYLYKSHALTSDLKPGQYYDLDTRLLHSMMNELVNFVEVEKAHMEIISHSDKYTRKFYRYRDLDAGLRYLEWETTIYNQDMEGKPTTELSQQAIAALWIMDAYDWWKHKRPNRIDPYDAFVETDYQDTCDYYVAIQALETQYFDEDTKYLTDLIKFRGHLWT